MKIAARLLLSVAVLASIAGCATLPDPSVPRALGEEAVPCFSCDGRVRRDVETGAPMFCAGSNVVGDLAPRFNADGTVARDPETGSPLYDETRSGVVSRVLVPLSQ